MTCRFLPCAAILILMSSILASCAASNAEILSEARSVEVSLMRYLPTGMVSWIHAQAADIAAGRTDEDGVRLAAADHLASDDAAGEGADVLTFFVMMEAVRQLDKGSLEDMKQNEAIEKSKTKLKAINAIIGDDLAKNSDKENSSPCTCSPYEPALSDLSSSLQQSKTWITVAVRQPADVGDLRALQQDLGYLSTTMEELAGMQAIRLQAHEDRMSKIMGVIANLLKRVRDSGKAMISNMKA